MKLIRLILISVSALIISASAYAAERVALVIGNGKYINAGALKNPINDATDVAAALRKLNFKVLLGTDMNYQDMRRLIQDFSREVANAEVATLYYAGHGLSVGGENYLLPIDAQLNSKTDLDFQALSLSLVQRQMERSASTRLIFMDACRNNPLTRSWSSVSRSTAGQGLSSPSGKTKGTYIAFATEPGNVALDGDGTRNSPFSAAFLKHVASPGLELASLMKRVRRDVTITTKDRQIPWSNSGLIGDFYFNTEQVSVGAQPQSAPPVSNTVGLELALWNEVKDSKDTGLLQDYIKRFPNGVFTSVAKRKVQQMASLQEALEPRKPVIKPVIAPVDDSDGLSAQAQYDRGVEYDFGRGVTQDYKEAARWYRKAANRNYAKAQTNLGFLYEKGDGVDKSFVEAARWYRKAADLGDSTGQANLGYLYENGLGVTQDYSEAVRWYRKAADQNFPRGQLNLGFQYEKGRGVTQDLGEAARLYRLAADQGSAQAQHNMGYLHEYGRGVKKDFNESVRWYRKAVEQNFSQSELNLGLLYEKGQGVTQSYSEAARLYRLAADKGNANAQTNLAYLHEHGQGVTKDYKESARWYRKAADKNFARAQLNLGFLYENGRGVPKDKTQAARYYRLAAEQDNTTAQVNFGYMLENGLGVTQNYKEAAAWYRKAADKNFARGQLNLGFLHQHGRGVTKDYKIAASLYRKAADQGNAQAQHNLGTLYESGRGVARNNQEAAKYVAAAIRGGNRFSLDQMTKSHRTYSKGFRVEMQRILRQSGIYSGSLDGSFGPGTITAIKKYANSNN